MLARGKMAARRFSALFGLGGGFTESIARGLKGNAER